MFSILKTLNFVNVDDLLLILLLQLLYFFNCCDMKMKLNKNWSKTLNKYQFGMSVKGHRQIIGNYIG